MKRKVDSMDFRYLTLISESILRFVKLSYFDEYDLLRVLQIYSTSNALLFSLSCSFESIVFP